MSSAVNLIFAAGRVDGLQDSRAEEKETGKT